MKSKQSPIIQRPVRQINYLVSRLCGPVALKNAMHYAGVRMNGRRTNVHAVLGGLPRPVLEAIFCNLRRLVSERYRPKRRAPGWLA